MSGFQSFFFSFSIRYHIFVLIKTHFYKKQIYLNQKIINPILGPIWKLPQRIKSDVKTDMLYCTNFNQIYQILMKRCWLRDENFL